MHSSCALEYGNVVLTGQGRGTSTHHLNSSLWRQAVWLGNKTQSTPENPPVHLASSKFHLFWEGILMAAGEGA